MPTRRDQIEQKSLGYNLLKFHSDIYTRIYFKTTVVGMDKVPFDETLIFALNHQNALSDALVLLAVRKWQLIFLARADIFKKQSVSDILTFLKIMPVYRIRDGYSNLQMNDEIFLKTLDVLKKHNSLALMPEGNHGDKRNLRPLKKGIARIAFQAEEASGNSLKIKIIPVGLEYTDYIKFRSKLLIRFGELVEVDKFLPLYKENPAQAYNALLDEFANNIKPEMIHIRDDEHYFNIEMLRKVFSPLYINKNHLPNDHNTLFEVDKKVIDYTEKIKTSQPDSFTMLMEKVSGYSEVLKINQLKVEQYPFKTSLVSLFLKIFLLIITIPLMLYGLINNIIWIWSVFKLSKKFKDPQFHSSIKLAGGMLLFPVVYLLQTIIFLLISGSILLTLAYIVSLPISAVILYNWRRYGYSVIDHIHLLKAKPSLKELKKRHDDIYEMIEI